MLAASLPLEEVSMAKKPSKTERLVTAAMREVHRNEPSTVTRAKVSGPRKEAMKRAIALEKAREAGAQIPRKRGTS
jgi:hypothetical protein